MQSLFCLTDKRTINNSFECDNWQGNNWQRLFVMQLCSNIIITQEWPQQLPHVSADRWLMRLRWQSGRAHYSSCEEARKEGHCETVASQKHGNEPQVGVPGGGFDPSVIVSRRWKWVTDPLDCHLFFLGIGEKKSRLKLFQTSREPTAHTHTHGWCRAQIRWLDPLASAAPYLHREASTSVARNTRQASGCASGRVLLHIVGPFFQLGHGLAPGDDWVSSALRECVCVCARGELYSPSRKCFCVGTGVGGVPGGSRRGRCERRPIGGACEFLQLHRDVRTVHLMNTVHSWENI